MRVLRHILVASILPFQLFAAPEQIPEPIVDYDILGDFTEKPFELKETVTVTLDGSEDADLIKRRTQTIQNLVFLNRQNWRVRKQLPFNHEIYEFLKIKGSIHSMTPTNRRVDPPSQVSDSAWIEVITSPLRLARRWNLADHNITFSKWIDRLKKRKTPLENGQGDRISLEVKDEKDGQVIYTVISTGSIMHEGKTLMRLESVWELKETSEVTKETLNKSLLRSL